MRLAELGFHDEMVRKAFEHRIPVVEEFEQADVALLCRCLPILAGGEIAGGVLLIRDVTDLRKRDRLLISKDATIREIHHRVKNNLQTISSLLRLQARRLENPEAKAAVSESVRRIRTIALVHESLSREPGDDVTFIEIVRPLLRLAEESLQSPDRPVHFSLAGDGGRIPARVATPLSVVLTELLQNAVDHGFPEGSGGGEVVVSLDNDEKQLRIDVIDDGRGLEAGFELDSATGLGLSIVRTLVTTELNGHISMRPATADDLRSAGPRTPPRRRPRHRGRARRPARRVTTRRTGRRQTAARARAARAARWRRMIRRSSSREAAPDPGVLIRGQREVETVTAHFALAAHLLGLLDLHQGRARGADGEEQRRVGVAAEGVVTPAVVRCTQGEA